MVTMAASEVLEFLSKHAREYGMTKLAKEIGVPRSHLYVALSKVGNPTMTTVFKVADALGMVFRLERKKKS